MSTSPMEAVGSDELSRLQTALLKFTECVGAALTGICSFGLTIGDTYVPFNPDEDDEGCDEEDVACSQVWVRVDQANLANVQSSFAPGGCGGSLRLVLEVGVLRCFPIMEEGEAPTATDVMLAALESMDDMSKLLCAAMSCGATEEDPEGGVWDEIVAGDWTAIGPLGGQYGGMWSFTVTLD